MRNGVSVAVPPGGSVNVTLCASETIDCCERFFDEKSDSLSDVKHSLGDGREGDIKGVNDEGQPSSELPIFKKFTFQGFNYVNNQKIGTRLTVLIIYW